MNNARVIPTALTPRNHTVKIRSSIYYLVDNKKTKTELLLEALNAVMSFSRSCDDVPPSRPAQK